MAQLIHGLVQWEDTGEPLSGATVLFYDAAQTKPLARSKTDKRGAYAAKWRGRSEKGCVSPIYAVVCDRQGRQLASTQERPLRLTTKEATLNLTVPANLRPKEHEGPKVQVGPLLLNAEAVSKAQPQVVLDIARAMVEPKYERKVRRRLEALSPELVPSVHVRHTLCGTQLLETIDALIKFKGWPREIALQVDDILRMRHIQYAFGFTEQVHECPNFRITFQDSGPAAVDPDTFSQNVIEPGGTAVLATLPAGDPPTYIKRICFWLERALATYTSPPFSMRNPAAGGKIPVVVNSDPFGAADPSTGTFFVNNALPPEVLCAVAVHELFHMVQFQYAGSGTWRAGMLEGGAVWAEDSAADLMNRYLDEAGTNINVKPSLGINGGYMIQPHTSLENTNFKYKTSLFWRYVAEQHSWSSNPAADRPLIGVETYRRIIEECEAGSWSSDDIKQAIRSLPWYQDFFEFGYLDSARQDLLSAETALGNFALACYLKDLGNHVPDRRFDFIEDEDNIHIDDVIATVIPGAPLQTTLASVTLAGSSSVTSSAAASFSSSVPRFGSRYYQVTVDPSVTNVEVQFTAGTGLTSCLFQIALIDENNIVREIYRTDRTSYTKRFPNLRDGTRLNRIVLVVTGAASSGSFTVTASPATSAPDVMVTRWHSVMKTEYEIDSRNWAWTWVSPDIWVDNDGDGLADSDVFLWANNKLHIRLHNKGNQNASGIGVEFWYQDAPGSLSPTAWLPIQDKNGVTQSLSGLSLPAGSSQDWSVDWAPLPSGASRSACVRAIITVPGDPNTDNKRALSSFGSVRVLPRRFDDIRLTRRNIGPIPELVELVLVPRLILGMEIAQRDLIAQRSRVLGPGEVSQDELRLSYWPAKDRITQTEIKRDPCPCETTIPQFQTRPDPLGHYPADPRTLPPGLADKPMLTITQMVDGVPQGGVTLMITPDDGARPRSRRKR